MPTQVVREILMPLPVSAARASVRFADALPAESIRQRSWKQLSRQLIMTRRIRECIMAESGCGVACMLKALVLEVAGAHEAVAPIIGSILPEGYRHWAQGHLESVLASLHHRETLGAHCAAVVAWGRAWSSRSLDAPMEKFACFLLEPWRDGPANDSAGVPGRCFIMCSRDCANAADLDAAGAERLYRELRRPHRQGSGHQRSASGNLHVISVMASASLARFMHCALSQDSTRCAS